MRVFVTGGAGFVGANLVHRLVADGHQTHVLVRPDAPVPWRLASIWEKLTPQYVELNNFVALRACLQSIQPDHVFHLAAQGAYPTQQDHLAILQTNVQGTAHVLLAAHAANVKSFVNAGSSSEYGLKPDAPKECDPLDPNSTYAASKAAATMFCRQYAREHGITAITLRLYSVYGPYEKPTRLMPTLATHVRRQTLPPLTDPATARDFVHVSDVVEAFVRASTLQDTSGLILNVGSGTQTSLADLIAHVQTRYAILERPRWATLAPRSWDTATWVADPSQAKRYLGWTPRVTVSDGLDHLLQWLDSLPPQFQAHYATGVP
ncbi:MAG: NAD-dependent epimerase/dehydratase family protein [Chloroflexota bacterium]